MSDLRLPELNKVFLAGRLTSDPELRYLPSNMAVAKLRMAVDRRYRTKDGEQRNETLFINVTAWGKTAEYCQNNLGKGRPIMVEGSLRSNDWEDKETGQKRTSIEVNADRVQTLDWSDRDGGSRPRSDAGGADAYGHDGPISEDDVPF